MARMNHRSFSSATALTESQMMAHAPSIFATDSHYSRSDRFSTIPTIEIVRGMEKEGFRPYSVGQCISRDESRQNFTKHMVRFRHAEIGMVNGSLFEVVLVNGNDGSAAYRLEAGVFRIACLNGLLVKSDDMGSLKVRHTGDVMHKVIEGSYKVLERAEETMDATRRWTGIGLTERQQRAFANGALVERFGEIENEPGHPNTGVTVAQILAPRRYDDVGNDLWRTFNRVQENVMKGGLTSTRLDSNNRLRRSTTREIQGIDQNVKLNGGLWAMASWLADNAERTA